MNVRANPIADEEPSLRTKVVVFGLIGGIITLALAWLLAETSLPRASPFPRDVFLVAIYVVPVGLTALLAWETKSHYWSVLVVAAITVVTLVGFHVFNIEKLFLFSFLLFAFPAVVAAQADVGVLPAIAVSAIPIAGFAFAGPGGRAGPLSLESRLYGTLLLVVVITVVAVALYLTVRGSNRILT